MNLKKTLGQLVRVVLEEADRNSEFANRLEQSLGLRENKTAPSELTRAFHRRAPAVLDPIELAREGETVLRARLGQLDIEKLKDIVAGYGMDPGKLVLKWKTPERIIDRIVDVSLGRTKKGEGFLNSRSTAR